MLRNLKLMQVDLSCNVELKDKITENVIGKCGYLFTDGETLDVECKDVSHIPDEVILELPSQYVVDELEEYFNRMFEGMMMQDV